MDAVVLALENAFLKSRLTEVEAALAEVQEANRRLEYILRAAHMKAHLRGAQRIFVDETRGPVLDPGRKATKSGFFWDVVSDDRGHGGGDPPIVLFHYAPGRGKEHPLKFLAGYRGRFLQCDAYQSYNALTEIKRDGGP